jgi:hypothetical protein
MGCAGENPLKNRELGFSGFEHFVTRSTLEMAQTRLTGLQRCNSSDMSAEVFALPLLSSRERFRVQKPYLPDKFVHISNRRLLFPERSRPTI